jgi:DNA helicase-2/ATP-dependent DNA helicase PcrA
MAVFYRTNALSRVIEDALRAATIPYTIARGTAFYEREEVKNALAYLRVVANPSDDVALARVINTPARGIGKTSLNLIEGRAAERRVPVFEVMREASQIGGLGPRAVASVQKFVEMIDGWTGAGSFLGAAVPTTLHELVERVNRESGLERHYDARAATSGLASDGERLDNLAELVSSAKAFEDEFDVTADPASEWGGDDMPDLTLDDEPEAADGPPPPPLLAMLRAYLESVALVADADAVDPEQGAVTLMTLHAAKGLEFPAVAIIGLEQGMLPHSRAAESQADLEEERRLAFVGITRAMHDLVLTSARYRTIRGVTERMIPSQFIDELGPQTVQVSDQAGGDLDERDAWDDRETPGGRRGPVAGPRSSAAAAALPVGAMVRHPQFGLGEVLSVQGGVNAKAQVRFRQVGVKTLILEYARLTLVER